VKQYKQQILKHLQASGWELTRVEGSSDWWFEEIWYLQSVLEAWGREITLTFLVDPSSGTADEKNPLIDVVLASTSKPLDRLDNSGEIAGLSMSKGLFEDKLRAFITALEAHRRQALDSPQ
jgi:hypothetical protein